MAHYAMVCDIDKCNGCYACFLSCKDEFVGNDHLPYAKAQPEPNGQQWMQIDELEHGSDTKIKIDYTPKTCRHCEEPACARNAPEGAVYRRADGIVIIDPQKAVGIRSIVADCPYGCVSWNEEAGLPQKCTLCAHMLDKGEKVTRCTECCPTGALIFGDLDDPDSEVSALVRQYGDRLECLGGGTGHLLRYIGLPRPFVAGEVICGRSGACLEGARVELQPAAGGERLVAMTDVFGDFQFKGLSVGAYTLSIAKDGCMAVQRTLEIKQSLNLGTISLP
jgi:Fe-S-cluster-containing dehydrogenase component